MEHGAYDIMNNSAQIQQATKRSAFFSMPHMSRRSLGVGGCPMPYALAENYHQRQHVCFALRVRAWQ